MMAELFPKLASTGIKSSRQAEQIQQQKGIRTPILGRPGSSPAPRYFLPLAAA
jgi:hypothetical protein